VWLLRSDDRLAVRTLGVAGRAVAAFELVEATTSSATRIDLLTGLTEDAGSKRELADRHDVSRSTVHRNLEPLEERGWVERRLDGTYRLTAVGERVAREVGRFCAGLEQTAANREFLEQYRGDVEIPTEVLAEVTASTATPANAQQATQHYLDTVDSAMAEGATVRMFVGTIGPLIAEVLDRLIESADRLEIIIDESTARADQYGYHERAERGEADGEFTLYVHPERLRFGLIIFDDRLAMVGAYDERGDIQAGLHGDGDAVLAWADDTYETVKQRSERAG
jgi:predicted transcriptional regulator